MTDLLPYALLGTLSLLSVVAVPVDISPAQGHNRPGGNHRNGENQGEAEK